MRFLGLFFEFHFFSYVHVVKLRFLRKALDPAFVGLVLFILQHHCLIDIDRCFEH